MTKEKQNIQELSKDLSDVFSKYGLQVLSDSVTLSTSPIRINIVSGLKTREVTLSFTEAVKLTDEDLVNIDEFKFIIEC